MDDPRGKKGIVVKAFGENLVFFENMSPKKAMCVVLIFCSVAFWWGVH